MWKPYLSTYGFSFIHSIFGSGDFITEVNGKKVHGVKDILEAIGLEVGKSLEIKVQRKNFGALTVSLVTAPEQ